MFGYSARWGMRIGSVIARGARACRPNAPKAKEDKRTRETKKQTQLPVKCSRPKNADPNSRKMQQTQKKKKKETQKDNTGLTLRTGTGDRL